MVQHPQNTQIVGIRQTAEGGEIAQELEGRGGGGVFLFLGQLEK